MSRNLGNSKPSTSDAQEAAWVADEDHFVLQQTKRKAAIRVKGGRAQPIDWLAVTLAALNPDQNPVDDEVELADLDLREPQGVFQALTEKDLGELERGIDGYLALEKGRENVEYWKTMKTTCVERRKSLLSDVTSARGVGAVANDLDKLLGPKTLPELEKLEKQIKTKLASDAPIDTDYWSHLLATLLTYKAKARLNKIAEGIVQSRLENLRKEHHEQRDAQENLQSQDRKRNLTAFDDETEEIRLDGLSEAEFSKLVTKELRKVLESGIIPSRTRLLAKSTTSEPLSKRQRVSASASPAPTSTNQSAAQAAFDRDLAKSLADNEELLCTEEVVTTKNIEQWSSQHPPRKPRYFARVISGFEWNKYNQTHYDADNPPPRVVQGYKFNVLYPDLVDVSKAPTYKIEREGGRRRGEMSAPAGEDDTCLIRFVAGAPYEDIAFRIIDREWDFSAKRDRGFKSRFEKGVLQLHFQFKKIYYRK